VEGFGKEAFLRSQEFIERCVYNEAVIVPPDNQI